MQEHPTLRPQIFLQFFRAVWNFRPQRFAGGYILSFAGKFIWVFQRFFHLHAPSPSLPDRARSTDCQPQAVRFLISLNFGLLLQQALQKSLLLGKCIPQDEGNSHIFSLSVWLFIYQSARGVYYTNHLCWKSVLALHAQVSNTVCKVFLSRICLEAPFTKARQFPSQQEILVLFPFCMETLHFLSGHF